MKTVLVLGAGVTRATRPKIALSQRAPLDADFFAIARAVNPVLARRVQTCLRSLVGDYADSLCQSLETATTYLYIKAIDSNVRSPYHTGLLDLLALLVEVLASTTNGIPVGPRSLVYRFLLSELHKLEGPEDLAIITFNYDLLFERTLQVIALRGHPSFFCFPGCYRLEGVTRTTQVQAKPQFQIEDFDHRGVALLKLHGSVNWQSSHTSSKPAPSALLNSNRELHVLDSQMISSSLSWRRNQRMVHMKPVIIPPVSGKRGIMQRDVLSLWSKSAIALQEADRVVVAGYSCPPLDLEARILLSENMRANSDKRVYVIDPNPAAAIRFLDLCGVDHTTIYTSIADWIRDARP